LDWEANVDPNFKDNHYLEPVPVADTRSEGYVDRWIVYGKIEGAQLFSAKELTVEPGAKCTIKDNGAYGLTCVQGVGKINGEPLNSPKMIRFTELTEDEYFCTEDGARKGVTFENTSETEPLVCLRYFGPEVNPEAPNLGAYHNNKSEIGKGLGKAGCPHGSHPWRAGSGTCRFRQQSLIRPEHYLNLPAVKQS